MELDTSINDSIFWGTGSPRTFRQTRNRFAPALRTQRGLRRSGIPQALMFLIAAVSVEIAAESAANLILISTPVHAGQWTTGAERATFDEPMAHYCAPPGVIPD